MLYSHYSATFRAAGLSQPIPLWRMPRRRPLPASCALPLYLKVPVNLPVIPTHLQLWQAYGGVCSQALTAPSVPCLAPAECGRAATKKDTHVRLRPALTVPTGPQGSKPTVRRVPRRDLSESTGGGSAISLQGVWSQSVQILDAA